MKTLEILKIEEVLGTLLKPLEKADILDFKNRNRYLLDKDKRLVGISLYDNQLTDISVLSSLKSLTSLNLGSNKLTDISAMNFCDL